MEELIRALHVLQRHCDNTLCRECEFYRNTEGKYEGCRLAVDYPAYWDTLIHELKEGEKER